MVLAALLLKLGGWGILVLSPLLCKSSEVILFFLVWPLFGRLVVRLLCLRHVDLKIIIAYSSVAHIGVLIGGLVIRIKLSVQGRFFIIIRHGLTSRGLFALANVFYQQSHTRNLVFLRG